MTDSDWGELATPALMRSARGAYAQSIRAQLHATGIDDLPRNGAFILAGIDAAGGPRHDLPSELGVTKQAVSQVIDLLVNRGYLEREPDRGDHAVAAVLRGVEAVDRQLEEVVSPEEVSALRSVLSALTDIKQTDIASGAGRARPGRQLRRFSPIFPVRDLTAALAHYATLGFRVFPYEEGDDYGFANRDGVGVHLAADPGHDRQRPGSAYLYVRNAGALSQEWSRQGIAGHTHPAEPTPWGML